MSEGRLPHTVNTRKAVTRSARYDGVLGAQELPRLADVLDPANAAPVTAALSFGRDDEGRQRIVVETRATVHLECQRCLERFEQQLESHSELAIVRTDEEAQQVPSRYEPALLGDEADLWEIVAEEIALGLPVAAMHAPEDCAAQLPEAADEEFEGQAAERSNPFAVLSTLLEESKDN